MGGAVRASQVVITGVPTKAYRLPSELIQPGTVVINVASYKNVDEESLLAIPGVRYVPMVGKVTVAMLLRNVLRLHENYHSDEARKAKEATPTVQKLQQLLAEQGAEIEQLRAQLA